ncbi:MAG: CPBP family intramembrane metalloprotease [Planctomycetes bacterium]|nr:CPBP family intramembrane metalloprotease [Planctomycetota bacterium]
MIWAFILLLASIITITARIRYGGDGLPYASPIPMSPDVWWCLGGVLALGSVVAAVVDRRKLSRDGVPRALVELLAVFVPLLVYVWAVYPDRGRGLRDFSVIGVYAVVLGCCSWRIFRDPALHGLTTRNFVPALRLLVLPTAIMVALCLAMIPIAGGEFRSDVAVLRIGTYLAWGLAQLFLFQAFLVPRLRELASNNWSIVVSASALFALIHWPNATLMLACATAGAIWTAVFLKVPNLYALNLSMVCSVAVFSAALPSTILRTHRIGPSYIETPPIASNHNAVVQALSSQEYFAQQGGTNQAYVVALYRDLLNRNCEAVDQVGWVSGLDDGSVRREEVVSKLMDCSEMTLRLKKGPVQVAGRRISW